MLVNQNFQFCMTVVEVEEFSSSDYFTVQVNSISSVNASI